MTLRRIKKRDGREVPFDEGKIRDAIVRAMAAVGEEDPAFASEVASVVRMTLDARYAPLIEGADRAGEPAPCPSIEEIQDLVEQALIELGQASVAKAYILYRDRRARIREALEVHRSLPAGERRPRIRVAESGAVGAWSKGRIVAALMSEAELPRANAEEIAACVEARVFDSGLRRISTALIRELVDNELVARGLDAALRRQGSVLLPLSDLRRELAVARAPLDPRRAASPEILAEQSVESRVAGSVLRRFAVEHVLDEASAEAHLSGELAVSDLERPHLYLWSALPAELFTSGEVDAHSAFATIEELARAARNTSQGVVLEDCAALLAPLRRAGDWSKGSRRGDARNDPLCAWLAALAGAAAGAERRIDLALSGMRPGDLAQRLIEALCALPESAHTPRLFLDEDELEALAREVPPSDSAVPAALDRLLLAGRVIPTWSSAQERFAAPGCQRRPRERAAISCGGAVAINFPRIALRAGPWREDRMLEGLANAITSAVSAIERLHAFQESVRAARPNELRGRVTFALAPVGLREALALLGDGEIRPEQGARLLGFASDFAAHLGPSRQMSLALTPFFGDASCERFAECDAPLAANHQELLFEGGVGAGLEPGRPYTRGYRLSPVPGCAPWAGEAELLSTVSVGALWPLPEDSSRGGLLTLAEACRRFFRLRRDPARAGEIARTLSVRIPHSLEAERASSDAQRELFGERAASGAARGTHAPAGGAAAPAARHLEP